MNKVTVATFVAGIDALINEQKSKKDVTIKIVATIGENMLTIYKENVLADNLQTDGFGAFRSEVNEITSYFKGMDIRGTNCILSIGDQSFAFLGGKFSNNINALLNGVVVRGGLLGNKKELKKVAKEKMMEKLLPKGSNLLQYVQISGYLDRFDVEDIKRGSSAIEFDGDGAIILPEPTKVEEIEVTNE